MDNNKEFKSLIIVDKFKWLYSKFGIDYKLMRNILKVKLTTDQRRVPTILNDYRDKKGENNKFNLVIIFYLFIGIFLAFLVGTNKNIIWKMNIYFTVFMFI
ncbi:ABC transporter permease, partial [Clostridium botulinum D/C]|nr:ABC transporter permease [Clostridium botulinum D/C]